jgi:signal transduction histidine kinase
MSPITSFYADVAPGAFQVFEEKCPIIYYYDPSLDAPSARTPFVERLGNMFMMPSGDHHRSLLYKDIKNVNVWIDLPLLAGGVRIGKISVDRRNPLYQQFTREEYDNLAILTRLASQALLRLYQSRRNEYLLAMWAAVLHTFITPVANIQFVWPDLVTDLKPHLPSELTNRLKDMSRRIDVLKSRTEVAHEVYRILAELREFRLEKVSVAELVSGVLREFRTFGHTVPIRVQCTDADLSITVDRAGVSMALLKVLDNACIYSGTEEILVDVQQTETRAIIAVKDAGDGIPADRQAMIFRPYPNIRTGLNSGGAGLGLFLAKLVTGLNRGELTFDSQEGNGTTFRFSFPISAGIGT